ncbi:MAG TPA: DUF4262 domain-containing protein [Streptosporangiaceae bacterium]
MMNPPRRRRVNPLPNRCRCAECEALAAGINPEAQMRAVADDINTVGWSVATTRNDAFTPPWAYTVGLWLSQNCPELTMAGLPDEHMTVILNSIAERIADGTPIDVADDVDGICPCTLTIRPVHVSWRQTSMFALSDRYYGYAFGDRPAHLQVVWPDRRGRYPGDRGFQARYDGRQPMLWLPVEDHPPSIWTRIDQFR